MTYGSDIDRQIHAHLHTAGRHLERGSHGKAEGHLIAATQLSEAAGVPTWGRWDLTLVIAREARRKLHENERRIKNREKAA